MASKSSSARITTKRSLCLRVIPAFILLLSFAIPINANPDGEMAVPVQTQYPLFLKILTYDRNLKSKLKNDLVIAVVYQNKYRPSLLARDGFIETVRNVSPKWENGTNIRLVDIELTEMVDLSQAIKESGAHVLYITPIRAYDLNTITEASRSLKCVTVTGVPAYAEKGMSVAIGTRDNKPLIIINLQATKMEGSDFNSRLLNLAKVIQ